MLKLFLIAFFSFFVSFFLFETGQSEAKYMQFKKFKDFSARRFDRL